jgi:hypothetical protein
MGSSTATMGIPRGWRRPWNAHSRWTHITRRSVGSSLFGSSLKLSRVNFHPHHGQFSSGTGEGLRPESLRNAMVRARAEYWLLSPFLPMWFGVAVWPTHRPISNGHGPSFGTSCWRSSSSAQMSVAARPSWSSVRSRNV